MNSRKVTPNQIDEYIQELESLEKQMDFLRSEMRNGLGHYQNNPGDEINAIRLQGYVAYYERFVRPAFIETNIPTKSFIEPSRKLTIAIDKNWKSYEFKQLFDGVDNLHKIFVLQGKLRKESPDLRISHEMTRSRVYRYGLLYYYLTPHEEIQVTSVQFASPGSISFEGLGDAVSALQKLLNYMVTFEFVKGFADVYDHFKYERPAQNAERRMKLKEVLEKEQSFSRNRAMKELEEYKVFLGTMNEIADLAIELDRKGLANGAIVEDVAIKSISYLNRLGFEQDKIKLPAP